MLKIIGNRTAVLTIVAFITIMASSCKKYLDLGGPLSEIEKSVVFSNDATATAAVLGLYPRLQDREGIIGGAQNSVLVLAGLSGDELVNYPRDLTKLQFENNVLTPVNSDIRTLWEVGYKCIYQANSALEGILASNTLTDTVSRQLQGEALFVRSLCYFNLVNLFGDIPLVLATDYRVNALAPRTSVNTMYEQITTDLLLARDFLSNDYQGSPERLRPNRSVANALLARVYLYRKDWAKAEKMATEVIDRKPLYQLKDSLQDVFLMNSTETIWSLRPTYNDNSGYVWEALYFTPAEVLRYNVFRPGLVKAFEPNDRRFARWVQYLTGSGSDTIYTSGKYRMINTGAPIAEYSITLRLAEQHLIRAEARAMQNKLLGADGAAADINLIRKRALLPLTTAATQEEMLKAIMQERRIEFLAEGGHRWFDLKRWNKATEVLAPIKGSSWQSTDALFPLPQYEIDNNPNLKPQNPGYN